MNCRKVKELLSSYIDKELPAELMEHVAGHLAKCDLCRKLEMDLKLLAVAPFRQAERVEVPDHLWPNIRNRIINQKIRQETGLLHRIFRPFTLRKPILAFATLTLCILLAVVFIARHPFEKQDPTVTSHLEEQLDFMSRLSNGGPLYNGNGSSDFGTSIEEFLL
jgi:predicted anti-sigma-YlaC factor YlaD